MNADEWCDLDSLADTLVIAPPGCGKTELLARRAAACIQRQLLPEGRKILALTFTNKARDNLASRMTEHVGPTFRRHVVVINFHGLGLHLYNRHRYVLNDPVRELLPDDRALRSIERRAFKEFSVPRDGQQDVRLSIREAKGGAFSDDEVISRIEASGSEAALWYERQIQSESRMDHDDVLRFGLRIIEHEGVAALYAERYAYLLVDEAQDLTRVQYNIIEPIGRSCTVFAGDRAQGIYAFAGADPEWAFARIHDRNPLRVQLDKSYRSSPEVLAVVSAIAAKLDAPELTSANPERWAGRGRTLLVEFDDQVAEAAWLIEQIAAWQEQALAEEPPREITIGVLTRMKPGGRRDVFLDRARTAELDVETWEYPLHRPEVVRLLRGHLDAVLATVAEPGRQVEELYLRCFSAVPAENASTLIDLRDAADELMDSIHELDLRTLIDRIRIGSDVDVPVGPGVHLLTGHTGKGQGFDKVVILGFEEGQVPSFFVKGLPDAAPEVREELALLHVMASRAKEELVLTICRTTNGYRQRPSRWLPVIEDYVERVM
ncbi:MAG: ATP-dependent helicase [Actinomycetota bacterium]|nr:ATP-dependent helicase [Actinomycetota bacterium]